MVIHSTFRRLFTYLASLAIGGAIAVRADSGDDLNLVLPTPGDHALHILTPTLLELKRINAKAPDPALVDSWNFFDSGNQFVAPVVSQFAVTVGGAPATVVGLGFKRRPIYAPDRHRDLRIENDLYLQLAAPIADGQSVSVTNPGALIFPGSESYSATADPLRFSPAIHVNEEGYVPGLPKKAMVGYYLGSLGELAVTATTFNLVAADTGAVVFTGTLTSRPDIGYVYSPTPYQAVLQADFSAFTTPGTYKLQVPGLGTSLPFVIDEGIAMGFLRTYALGLYHQRCGTTNALPFTRFVHDACHTAPVEIPTPAANFAFTWATIATKNADFASNPRHTAPQLVSEATQLYPFVNTGTIDVSGGHHDAGDYSRYTINSAALVHHLMFTVDAIPGAAALDNLGLPESGDGISDLMQEAKLEADFLAKMQDADGGFYFLVYPKNREYELDVLPDHGDAQVVWPKNTAVTAAAVAALAQCASSPAFRAAYPAAATAYLQKATLGWQFLVNAIAAHGKDGAYQKITFYGDTYMHDDELAWAACEMFLATGDPSYQQKLFEWFPDPSDPNTFRFGWWRMSESWGNAIRSYAFAARSGRLAPAQLDATYLAQCEAQIVAAGDDALQWSADNAYATSFPEQTKAFNTAGFYFSLDQASDMAVAFQIVPKPAYLDALLGNLNYEAGTNPVNVSYLTGRGQKRQREIVDQYAQNDRRVLPPDGIPLGNIQSGFAFLGLYGFELGSLVFPADGAPTAPYPFYDRWGDSYNVTTEFIGVNQARALTSLAVLATHTAATAQP
ncbi:MAG TPA: glycoside hydrolase family 9 protein, partial [Opitutaceae bacterium]|nr:glycoside hydrolase family 9 protein [Opitutaceae bacterium]